MDALERAIKQVGSQAALARAIDVAQQVVNNWLRRGNVPAEYCPTIERAVSGAVRCEDLRPDVDWAYLRATGCECPKVAAGETPLAHANLDTASVCADDDASVVRSDCAVRQTVTQQEAA